jgi:hypothetical protein
MFLEQKAPFRRLLRTNLKSRPSSLSEEIRASEADTLPRVPRGWQMASADECRLGAGTVRSESWFTFWGLRPPGSAVSPSLPSFKGSPVESGEQEAQASTEALSKKK